MKLGAAIFIILGISLGVLVGLWGVSKLLPASPLPERPDYSTMTVLVDHGAPEWSTPIQPAYSPQTVGSL